MPRAAIVVERPDKRRAREQVARELRKSDVVGAKTGDDLGTDLPDRGFVVAQKTRRHRLLDRAAVVLPAANERYVAADVLAEQLVGLQQIVLVVLLEHADASGLGQRPEMNRRRVYRRRDIHELQIESPAWQLERAHIANK